MYHLIRGQLAYTNFRPYLRQIGGKDFFVHLSSYIMYNNFVEEETCNIELGYYYYHISGNGPRSIILIQDVPNLFHAKVSIFANVRFQSIRD